ncbi:MAG: nuclear transport factor 2 family protein [Sphingomicrobium sp.]
MDGIDAWHAFVDSRDLAALNDLLDPNVAFDSPVVHTTQHGPSITARYLGAAMSILGGPDFRYSGEWRNRHGAVLEFETIIDGVTINGVDIIGLTDDRQRIASFKVMIRPLKAINMVHRLMGERLARSA